MRDLSPAQLNGVARLLLIADRHGPEFLYDLERLENVVGRSTFSELDGQPLRAARCIIEAPFKRLKNIGRDFAQTIADAANDKL